MATGDWIALDEYRSAWVLLLVDSTLENGGADRSSQISHWELGVGNADSLVETLAERVGGDRIGTEEDLLNSLLNELDKYRYDGTVIITPDGRTLRQVRRRLLATNIPRDRSTLHGFSHICAETILRDYFGQELPDHGLDRESRTGPRETEAEPSEVVCNGDVETFWETWTQMFRLIPPAEITGTDL